MLKKIKRWWTSRKHRAELNRLKLVTQPTYTLEQLENVYRIGYNDGKRDGLVVAREQATNSLKEILWHQNQSQ